MSTQPWLGNPDPDDPWVVGLVVASAKSSPVLLADLLEAGAAAVGQARDLLPEAFAAYEAAGRIRKIARHAPPARLETIAALPQAAVRVRRGSADVVVIAPAPRSQTPDEVDRAQLMSGPSRFGVDLPATPAVASLVRAAVTPHLPMSPLKLLAQAGHAGQIMHRRLTADDPEALAAWRAGGFACTFYRPPAPEWDTARAADVVIVDAGLTELAGPGHTISAWYSCRG